LLAALCHVPALGGDAHGQQLATVCTVIKEGNVTYVRKWCYAGRGNPQFTMATFLTCASVKMHTQQLALPCIFSSGRKTRRRPCTRCSNVPRWAFLVVAAQAGGDEKKDDDGDDEEDDGGGEDDD
jgi:hypothetical protein